MVIKKYLSGTRPRASKAGREQGDDHHPFHPELS